jgi:ERCC4-type nuclease
MLKLKIDYREKKIIELLNINDEFKTKRYVFSVENLTLGDITICDANDNEIVLIERKSISDLSSSIIDGRYNEQSYRLNNNKLHNHNIIYLIEGNLQLYRPYSKINKKTIYSSMVTLNYHKGFSVMRSMNINESVDIIIRMFDKIVREQKEGFYKNINIGEIVQNASTNQLIEYSDVIKSEKKSNITRENIYVIMLCQIPYISSTTAKAILKYYDYATLVTSIDLVDLGSIKVVSTNGKERKLSSKIIENLKKYLG